MLGSRVPDAPQRETLLRRAGTHISPWGETRLGPGSAARRYTLHRALETGARDAAPHTIRNTTAPNAPAHSAIAAMPWIAKPGPRFAAACE